MLFTILIPQILINGCSQYFLFLGRITIWSTTNYEPILKTAVIGPYGVFQQIQYVTC